MKRLMYLLLAMLLALVLPGCSNPAGPEDLESDTTEEDSTNDSSDGTDDGTTGTQNSAPYLVTLDEADADATLDGHQVTRVSNARAAQYVDFRIDTDAQGLSDPDGDTVYFRPTSFAESYLSLNETTGRLTITADGSLPSDGTTVTIEVWSEDEHGADTQAQAFVLDIVLEKS